VDFVTAEIRAHAAVASARYYVRCVRGL
jgi:hypothetical protein